MALNLEQILNNAKNIARGEAAGSIKFMAVLVLTLAIWVGVLIINGWASQSQTNLRAQQSRLRTLLTLSDEYKAIAPKDNKKNNTPSNVDVPTVFKSLREWNSEAVLTALHQTAAINQ